MRNFRRFLIFSAGLIAFVLLFGTAFADAGDFEKLISDLKAEQLIPESEGKTTSYGSYTDNFAKMGFAQWFPFTTAEHFVLSANLSWVSASQTPNGAVSGCGIVFGVKQELLNYLMVSFRMDGNAYIKGSKNLMGLHYGMKYYSRPSMQGEGNLVLIVDGLSVTVYFNDNVLFSIPNAAIDGDGIGYAVLSGTNKEFGTRCNFDDVYIYTWEEPDL